MWTPVPTLPPPAQTEAAATLVAQGTQVVVQQTAAVEATATALVQPGARECYECATLESCSSGYGTVCFLYPFGKPGPHWVDFWYCQPGSECEPSTGPGEEECVPGNMTAGPFTLDRCEGMDWAADLWVEATIPAHIVQMDPFPHWMVAMGAPLPEPFEGGEPGTLTLQDYPALSNAVGEGCAPEAGGEGCWSEPAFLPDPPRVDPETGEVAPLPGDIRDYRIGLRWRRVDVMPSDGDPGGVPAICWDWDEREWNVGQDYGYGPISSVSCGTSVSHIYETSSWGKPKNGPNFIPAREVCRGWGEFCYRDNLSPGLERQCHCCEQIPGEWRNPAYQVRVATYWAVEWAVAWEAWEEIGGCDAETCGCKVCEDPGGCADRCNCHGPNGDLCVGEGEFCDCEPEYGWVDHFEGWNVIDLRAYGEGTWYATSYSVYTTGAFAQGMGCESEFRGPARQAVTVPVIEVQSVLRDPCVIDGSCPEGYP